jgi:hypothetical protein
LTPRPTHKSVAGTTYLALQKKARAEGRPTDELLQLHALECYLDRITTSAASANLVLKGGVLLAAYNLRRPTRDIDLSATRLSNDERAVLEMATRIRAERREDGWVFGAPTHELIRDEQQQGLDEIAQARWSRWVRKMKMLDRLPDSFRTVLDAIRQFADPVLEGRVSSLRWHPDTRTWSAPRA